MSHQMTSLLRPNVLICHVVASGLIYCKSTVQAWQMQLDTIFRGDTAGSPGLHAEPPLSPPPLSMASHASPFLSLEQSSAPPPPVEAMGVTPPELPDLIDHHRRKEGPRRELQCTEPSNRLTKHFKFAVGARLAGGNSLLPSESQYVGPRPFPMPQATR